MKNLSVSIMICCIVLVFFLSGCEIQTGRTKSYEAESIEQAVFKISEDDFVNGNFSKSDICDKDLIEYKEIVRYDHLTEHGTIYAYELHYKVKTDNPQFLIEEKLTDREWNINEWIPDLIAGQCIIVFENHGQYYNLECLSALSGFFEGSFRYEADDYGTTSSCGRDALEYRIISNIFEHTDVAGLQLRQDATSERLLRKLINDIIRVVRPAYDIDIRKCRLYHITYDYEIHCIYFKADLYTNDNRVITENTGFSMFWFQSGEEIENLPKTLEPSY